MEKTYSRIILVLPLISILTLAFNIQPTKAEDYIWKSEDIGHVRCITVDDIDDDDVNELIVGVTISFTASTTRHGYIYVFNAVTYELEWRSEDIGDVGKIIVADIEGDGTKEIIAKVASAYGVGDRYEHIYVFDAVTYEHLWKSDNIGWMGDLVVEDLDGDGVKEIVTGGMHYSSCTRHGHVYVFDGNDFSLRWKSGDINSLNTIVVADADDDGVKEIIFSNCVTDCASSSSEGGFYYPGYIFVFDGITFVQEWKSDDIGVAYVNSIIVDDVDDDGVKEIIGGIHRTSSPNVDPSKGYIYVYNGKTHALEWRSPRINSTIHLKVEDIDHDDAKEIIARTWKDLYVFDGETHVQEWHNSNMGESLELEIIDIDKDGVKEVITRCVPASYLGHLCSFDGVTHEEEWKSINVGIDAHSGYSLTVADLDDDGWEEIIACGITEPTHGYIYVFACARAADIILSIKSAGEFDYLEKEKINIRIAVLVKDKDTDEPVSGSTVTLEVFAPDGEKISNKKIPENMIEKMAGSGIYEVESLKTIDKLKLDKGIYLVHIKASYEDGPMATDIIEFHIDPPTHNYNLYLLISLPIIIYIIIHARRIYK